MEFYIDYQRDVVSGLWGGRNRVQQVLLDSKGVINVIFQTIC